MGSVVQFSVFSPLPHASLSSEFQAQVFLIGHAEHGLVPHALESGSLLSSLRQPCPPPQPASPPFPGPYERALGLLNRVLVFVYFCTYFPIVYFLRNFLLSSNPSIMF